MVILSVQFDQPEIYELLEAVNLKFPGLTSLMYTINPKKNETLYDQEIITFSGRDHIFEKLEDLTFKIGPKSFFQTNSHQALELYGKPGNLPALPVMKSLYDLYTGTGTIANFMATRARYCCGH